MKKLKILYLLPLLFSITGCDFNVNYIDIKTDNAIWIDYDNSGPSYYDVIIDTDGNPNDIKFEYSEEGFIEVNHLRDNAFRIKQLKSENKTITLTAKIGNRKDNIRVHLVYLMEYAGNITSDYLWYYMAPGYTYDMMWRTTGIDCGFAVEIYVGPSDVVEVVDQNKIKTKKEGKFSISAYFGLTKSLITMIVSNDVPYNPDPKEPMYIDYGVNIGPGDQ